MLSIVYCNSAEMDARRGEVNGNGSRFFIEEKKQAKSETFSRKLHLSREKTIHVQWFFKE